MYKRYFSELKKQEAAFVQNPFSIALNVREILDELQDQFYNLQNHSFARDFFRKWYTHSSGVNMHESSYSLVSELVFRILLSFATAYLCESGFLVLVHIKTKARNRRKVEDDARLIVSNTNPRIPKLALRLQSQPSH